MSAVGASPDFIIIGTQRGGTTSLHHYLAQHPLVAVPERKELHFFSLFYDRGAEWYRAQFPSRRTPTMVTGEATPYYLFHPLAPARVRKHALEAKLIVLLREPVDRAYSHYHLMRQRGQESLSFADAIRQEDERTRGEVDRLQGDETYRGFAHQHFSYLARGRYAEQLRAWFELFPRDQFLILESEVLYRDPVGTVRAVTDFLGLPSHDMTDIERRNEVAYPPLSSEIRQRLDRYFVEPNRDLVAVLGAPISWARP